MFDENYSDADEESDHDEDENKDLDDDQHQYQHHQRVVPGGHKVTNSNLVKKMKMKW